jgi:hypothetical protein
MTIPVPYLPTRTSLSCTVGAVCVFVRTGPVPVRERTVRFSPRNELIYVQNDFFFGGVGGLEGIGTVVSEFFSVIKVKLT